MIPLEASPSSIAVLSCSEMETLLEMMVIEANLLYPLVTEPIYYSN